MALTYIGANGIFTQIGKMIKVANTYDTLGLTTLNTDLTDIRTILNAGNAGNRDELIALFTNFYGQNEGSSGARSLVTSGWRDFIRSCIDQRLLDYDTVVSDLDLASSNLDTVLARLIDQMTIDAASVNASVGSLGGASAASGNVGNGAALHSLVMDGATSPGQGMPAHQRYRGLNSELIGESETMTLHCVADSQGSGGGGRTVEGAEVFRLYGNPKYNPLGWEAEGSGEGPSVVVANAPQFNLVQNKDFEYFTANIPNGWTRDAGTAGTHIIEESTAADVYRGKKALRFDGDGVQASIQLSQIIPLNRLKARTRYCLTLRTKASATIAAGDLTVQFEGTGYTAATGTVEIQTVAISGSPTGGTYTLTWAGPFGSSTTAAIAWDATSATVQAALRLLTGLESVTIAQSGVSPNFTHTITFSGTYGNIAQLTSTSSLTGGTPVITHATTTQGVDGERIYLPAASLPTTQSLRYFWINMPASIPIDDTFKLVIKVTGTLTSAKKIWIDSMTFREPTWHNGHAVIVVAGATPWKFGDRLTYTASNTEGVIQKWMRLTHGIQLPSNDAGAETIVDSLAT